MVWDAVRLALVCALYLLVVLVTTRGFIAAPLRRVQTSKVNRLLNELSVLAARHRHDDEVTAAATKSLRSALDGLQARPKTSARPRRPWLWVVDSPLTKLYADQQQIDSAQRGLVDLVLDDALDSYAEPILHDLSTVDPKATDTLRDLLHRTKNVDGKRFIISYAHKLTQSRMDANLAIELEDQRIALWLASIGLFGVLIIGLVTPQHQISLLFGAIGGFLAPLVRISTGHKASSWGVMVLSPVGGALTAAGGLVLVRLLSDKHINVLGEVFRNNSWDAPANVIALAVALLFGFSGRLFSSLAIAGTSQLSQQAPEPTPNPS